MKVSEICTQEVIVAERQASILELAQLMRKHHVGNIVIVDQVGLRRKPVGIVTDRDIVLELLAKEEALDSVNANDIMSADLVTVGDYVATWDAMEVMREHGVRRLPVVDGVGLLTGIITTDDILETLAEQILDLVMLFGREARLEKKSRP